MPEHSQEPYDNPPIYAQSIPFRKFHKQLINPGAIPQNLTILGRPRITAKTARNPPGTTAQLAHDPGMPGTINLNCIWIAILEGIASQSRELHKDCVDRHGGIAPHRRASVSIHAIL